MSPWLAVITVLWGLVVLLVQQSKWAEQKSKRAKSARGNEDT